MSKYKKSQDYINGDHMPSVTLPPLVGRPIQTAAKVFSATPKGLDPLMRTYYDSYPEEIPSADAQTHASRFAVGNTERPTDINFRVTKTNNWWFMYARMYQYRQEVSILSTLISRSVTELLRYDLKFEPKFAKKCMKCGYETRTMTNVCPECGSKELRRPDKSQLEYFKRPNGKSFLDEANDSGQTLKEVIRSYAEMQYLCNQGYLLCIARDIFDPLTGKIHTIDLGEGKKEEEVFPVEFISLDPIKVQQLFDDSGTPGREYGFILADRHTPYSISDDIDKINQLTEKGIEIYPAAYKVGDNLGASGQSWYYMQHEIYQDHWFRPALTYGMPIWYDIEDDLQAWHFIEKSELKKRKFGYVRKIVILPGFNDEDAIEVARGITDTLATNDNSIPIVCTPPQLQGVAEMRAQVLDLMSDATSDMLASKDDIRNRLCAHIGVPNLFAGDVEASGGMNNESQQITVYDRYLMHPMSCIDRACDWIVSWWAGKITDWDLRLDRPTKAMADAKKRMDKIDEMLKMIQGGYEAEYVDGEFYYSREPVQQVDRRMQMQQMMMQQQAEAMGRMPGDGSEGPPEKGTARRDDPDVDASKSEVEDSMREMAA